MLPIHPDYLSITPDRKSLPNSPSKQNVACDILDLKEIKFEFYFSEIPSKCLAKASKLCIS